MDHLRAAPAGLRRCWVCLFIAAQSAAALATAGSPTPQVRAAYAQRVAFDAGAPGETFSGFIVYYHHDAPPGESNGKAAFAARATLQHDLQRVGAVLGVKAVRQRRLATGGHLVRLSRPLAREDADRFMIEMASGSEVAYIEPDVLAQPEALPNDTWYGEQWALREARAGINVEAAWDYSLGNDVVIAVLDTGITRHPDLDAKVLPGYDFISDAERARDGDGRDGNAADRGDWKNAGDCGAGSAAESSTWHGTHVAGVAAALTNNGRGVAGVAPGAWLQPVRVLGRCGGLSSDIADAIVWASGGSVPDVADNPTPARVLNLSLGSWGGGCGWTYQRAVDSAMSRGAIVVAAAGNDAAAAALHSPSNCDGIIAVAAMNRAGLRSSYSNYGLGVDVAAPGGEFDDEDMLLGTRNDGQTTPGNPVYDWMNGTSVASPVVAGVVALMLQRKPSLDAAAATAILRDTARPYPSYCVGGCGTGIVDAAAAVRIARGGSHSAFPLSLALYGNGEGKVTSSPAGIDCGRSCSNRFDRGRSVTLRAAPQAGYAFTGWRGACTGTAASCTVDMDAGRVVEAVFEIPVVALDNGSVRRNLVKGSGPVLMFALEVPAGASNLKFAISGGTGDADLYVRHDEEPDTDQYDCRPWRYGNNEVCSIDAPLAGTWYVMLDGDPSFGGVTLAASYVSGPEGGKLLSRNVVQTGVRIPTGGGRYFRFNVPEHSIDLTFGTIGGSGDLDLYLSHEAIPTPDDHDCASENPDNAELCMLAHPAAGTWYALLYGYSDVDGARVAATYARAERLQVRWIGSGAGTLAARRVSTGVTRARCTELPCTLQLDVGATFDLLAVAAPGSRFNGWRPGECDSITAVGNCRVRMNARRAGTLHFVRTGADSPVLTVERVGGGHGSVAVRRVATGSVIAFCEEETFPCRIGAPAGGAYEFIAYPAAGSSHAGWVAGQCDSVTAFDDCRVDVDGPTTVTVRFSGD